MADAPCNVLFLCTHNSARSVMAECLLNRAGGGRFRAWSAGSVPSGRLNPYVVEHLEHLGHATAGLRSKSWDELAAPGAPEMQVAITVCDAAAGEACPIWPGRPVTAHWPFEDPSSFAGSAAETRAKVAEIYGRIERCIDRLVALPVETLGPDTLRRRLAEIGATAATPGPA